MSVDKVLPSVIYDLESFKLAYCSGVRGDGQGHNSGEIKFLGRSESPNYVGVMVERALGWIPELMAQTRSRLCQIMRDHGYRLVSDRGVREDNVTEIFVLGKKDVVQAA